MLTKISLVMLFTLTCPTASFAQENDWKQLKPLESTREEVERLTGKPEKYFATYGLYTDRPNVEFSAWYSDGSCDNKKLGISYDVRSGLLTRLYVAVKVRRTLSDFEADLSRFSRVKFDNKGDVVYYYSTDESIVYKAFIEKDGSELVVSIAIQPGDGKEDLKCKTRKPKSP